MTPDQVRMVFESGVPDAKTADKQENEANEANEAHEAGEAGDAQLSQVELARRTEQLRQVLSTAQQLLASNSEDLDKLAEQTGDGSRDASWRLPIGRSGLLQFFIDLVVKGSSEEQRQGLRLHTLRVIGNACADTEENRERVVAADGVAGIVKLLGHDAVTEVALPVLFNVCVDYEPAQIAAYKAGLNPELVRLISSGRLTTAEDLKRTTCRLLGLVVNQEADASLVDPATPFVLFKLSMSTSQTSALDDFISQMSVALAYLSNPTCKDFFLKSPAAVAVFLGAFSNSCTILDQTSLDPDDTRHLRSLQSVFTQVLADLSAHPLFPQSYASGAPEAGILRDWMSSSYTTLQSAACLALGNLSRSDESSVRFVQSLAIHKPLVAILASPSATDPRLLHAALGFLRNLAIPPVNKPVLGKAGLLDAGRLPRLWELDSQVQVQFAAVSLVRLLLVSCPANVRRLCAPLSSDACPAKISTPLQRLVTLCSRSDQEPTKMEAARAVVALLRVLHTTPHLSSLLPPSTTSSTALQHFYSTNAALCKPLTYLGVQSKFPTLRSELWFVMALMSRTLEGATMVARALEDTDLLRALSEAVAGSDMTTGCALSEATTTITKGADATAAGASDGLTHISDLEPQEVVAARQMTQRVRIDRENGLVLMHELVTTCPDRLQPAARQTIRNLLQVGAQKVLQSRGAGDDQGAKRQVAIR